jgi:hypothetical protein
LIYVEHIRLLEHIIMVYKCVEQFIAFKSRERALERYFLENATCNLEAEHKASDVCNEHCRREGGILFALTLAHKRAFTQ